MEETRGYIDPVQGLIEVLRDIKDLDDEDQKFIAEHFWLILDSVEKEQQSEDVSALPTEVGKDDNSYVFYVPDVERAVPVVEMTLELPIEDMDPTLSIEVVKSGLPFEDVELEWTIELKEEGDQVATGVHDRNFPVERCGYLRTEDDPVPSLAA